LTKILYWRAKSQSSQIECCKGNWEDPRTKRAAPCCR